MVGIPPARVGQAGQEIFLEVFSVTYRHCGDSVSGQIRRVPDEDRRVDDLVIGLTVDQKDDAASIGAAGSLRLAACSCPKANERRERRDLTDGDARAFGDEFQAHGEPPIPQGPWTMDSGPWTKDDGPWTINDDGGNISGGCDIRGHNGNCGMRNGDCTMEKRMVANQGNWDTGDDGFGGRVIRGDSAHPGLNTTAHQGCEKGYIGQDTPRLEGCEARERRRAEGCA